MGPLASPMIMDSNQAKTSSSCTNQSFDHNRSNNNNINKSALPDNQEEEIPCVRLSPSSSSHLMRLLDGSWDNIFRQWQILAFGQVVSFLNVANGAAQASLALSCHLYAPLFTLGLVYSILAMGLIPLWWKRRNEQDNELEDELLNKDPQSVATHATTIERCMTSSSHGNQSQPAFLPDPTRKYSLFGIVRLNAPAIAYLPMAVLDVSAQFFFLTALRYTTLTSVTLLDSVAIPAAMLLSSLLLARKYRPAHFLGICLCFVGIYIDVFHDYTAEDETETDGTDAEDYPHKLRGDLMAIAGACMFGTQEVLGEVAVRNLGGTNEYIALLGFWASMIAFLHSYLTEKDHIVSFFQEHDQAYCEKNQAWTLLFVYVLSTSLYYHGLARFLKMSDAAFFNLSLLTGAGWSVLFGVLVLNRLPKPIFFVAVFFIVTGVITYEMASTPVVEDTAGHALENKAFRQWRRKTIDRLRQRKLARQLQCVEMNCITQVIPVEVNINQYGTSSMFDNDLSDSDATGMGRVIL